MMHIVLGIGCVVIAAAVAIYFSMPAAAPPPAQHRRRNNNWQSNDNDDEEDYHSIGGPSNYTKKSRAFRPSKPGDKCICLEIMTADNMRTMHCGHALHESPCYEEYRNIRRQCPHCNQLVIRIDLPGDTCSICCEPMEQHTMEYLKCEHALHQTCLGKYKRNDYISCPVCKRPL